MMTLTAANLLNIDLASALRLTDEGAALLSRGEGHPETLFLVEGLSQRDPYARTAAVAAALRSPFATVERVTGPAEEADVVPVAVFFRGVNVAVGGAREAHVAPGLTPRESARLLGEALGKVRG